MNAQEIRELREAQGLNQDEFAVKLGVSPMTLRRWESGKTQPSRMAQKLLEKVTKKLNK